MEPDPAAIDRRSWGRLQACLGALKPGDVVTVTSLATQSGVRPGSVEMVLQGLTRAQVFAPVGPARFMRLGLARG